MPGPWDWRTAAGRFQPTVLWQGGGLREHFCQKRVCASSLLLKKMTLLLKLSKGCKLTQIYLDYRRCFNESIDGTLKSLKIVQIPIKKIYQLINRIVVKMTLPHISRRKIPFFYETCLYYKKTCITGLSLKKSRFKI